jgi:Protein of unknown function (DUF2800)
MTEVAGPDSHSELPPSSADKWFHCHAWRRQVVGIEDSGSAAADEGTLAHEWLAEHLLGRRDLAKLDNEEMFDYLMSCVEWIEQQPGEHHIEQKVDFGEAFGFVDLTGTSDLILVHDDHITIGDLKYGRGVVEVEDNLQLLTYLVGAVHRFGQRPSYRLVILQPRAWHQDGPIREATISNEKFLEFREKLEKAIEGNYSHKSKHSVGPWCRKWCKGLATCPAAKKHSLSLLAQYPMDDE